MICPIVAGSEYIARDDGAGPPRPKAAVSTLIFGYAFSLGKLKAVCKSNAVLALLRPWVDERLNCHSYELYRERRKKEKKKTMCNAQA